MKIADVRSKTIDELKQLLLNLKKEAFNLRFQKVSGEINKLSRVREVRKDVARVKTVINEIARKKGQEGVQNG